jgi:hypothetical protein
MEIPKPAFCARCHRKPRLRWHLQRHHIAYGRDRFGNEATVYLCRDCHETIGDLNALTWHIFGKVFGREPAASEWPEIRTWILTHFLKTELRRWRFEKIAQHKVFLRGALRELKANTP